MKEVTITKKTNKVKTTALKGWRRSMINKKTNKVQTRDGEDQK